MARPPGTATTGRSLPAVVGRRRLPGRSSHMTRESDDKSARAVGESGRRRRGGRLQRRETCWHVLVPGGSGPRVPVGGRGQLVGGEARHHRAAVVGGAV